MSTVGKNTETPAIANLSADEIHSLQKSLATRSQYVLWLDQAC